MTFVVAVTAVIKAVYKFLSRFFSASLFLKPKPLKDTLDFDYLFI